MLWTILFWAAIALGVLLFLLFVLWIAITNELVKNAMNEGETGWKIDDRQR